MRELQLYNTNRTVDQLQYWRDDGSLLLDTPYQRGDVWGKKRQKNLILSLVRGVPIPSLVINNRMRVWSEDSAGWDKMAVIDGRQRIQAILGFMDNQFSVPMEWFQKSEIGAGYYVPEDQENKQVLFADLTDATQRRFGHLSIAVSEGSLPTVEYEKLVFDLINFGGLQQGEVDEDR